MAFAVYCRPTDIVTAHATITASAADSEYPAALLGDSDPAHPAKLTTTSGWWLFDFGSAQSLDLVALIQHNRTGHEPSKDENTRRGRRSACSALRTYGTRCTR